MGPCMGSSGEYTPISLLRFLLLEAKEVQGRTGRLRVCQLVAERFGSRGGRGEMHDLERI